MGTATSWAQIDYEEGYRYLYSTSHRVKVRKPVECIRDHQSLWNGTQVRLTDDMVCIYRDSTCITCGIQVWLEHTGYYTIQRDDDKFYLIDPDGHPTGVQGDELQMLWNGVVCVLNGDKYHLSTTNNQCVGTISADKPIEIYYNGYYCYHNKLFYCVATPEGVLINNSYSDTKPELLDNGVWRCKRDGRAFFVDIAGYVYS